MNEVRRGDWWRVSLRVAVSVALGAWLGGLVVAAFQLPAWSNELVRTLLQIRADAVFRMRMDESREPIPREWFRSKTLALLAASEKLRDETLWEIFIPGSRPPFDNLRQRAAARIERAFSDIAVETVRRELYFRASELTGVPQDSRSAELLAGRDCAPAAPANRDDPRTAGGAQESAEYLAVQNQLASIEALDRAARAMLALQKPTTADAENLRLLVRYTLGVELSGELSRSAAFFRTGLKPEDVTYSATGVPRLQWAARCSVAKGMRALDKRVFERNDLMAAQEQVGQSAARLFAPGSRPGNFTETVAGYREVLAALEQQEALLARADHAWLHDASNTGLGTPHERLLARIARIALLGPEAAEQIRRESGIALKRFRRQFAAVFEGHGEGSLVWRPELGRLALSPQRVALRDGLQALLREPFMQPTEGRAFPPAPPAPLSWDTRRLEQALSIADTRRRFAAEDLPRFPVAVRPRIAQLVDARLAQLVQDATVQAISRPGAAEAVLTDTAAYRAQRMQLAKVQALLGQLGAHARAENLRALLSRDLLERLALMEQAVGSSSTPSGAAMGFGGPAEGVPVSPALQAGGNLAVLPGQMSLRPARLGEFADVAATYLAYVDPSIAASPTVLRWQGTLAQLRR